MRFTNKLFVFSVIVGAFLILQAHADGRAGRDRDNTGAPGGQSGGGGRQITCNNCHENGALEVALNMSLLDENENPVETYVPNEVYTAKVTIDHAPHFLLEFRLERYGGWRLACREPWLIVCQGFE